MNLTYIIGVLIHLPLLPLMYLHGKRIKRQIPELPEATGPKGKSQYPNTHKHLKMLAIGESTIAGIGVKTHQEGFTGTLASELGRLFKANVQWKVYAKSGYSAKRVRQEIIPTIIEKEIDLLVVGIGGNDAFELNTPWRWKREVEALIQSLRIKFPDAPIVFCNMPPIKEFPAFSKLIKSSIGNLGEILGANLREVVKNHDNIYYHDKILTLKSWNEQFGFTHTKSDYFSDGVHPSKLAYQTWALDIATEIKANDLLSVAHREQ